MKFLEHAKIGYVCWHCKKDTHTFVSDTEWELCHNCHKSYQSDYQARVERLITENNLIIEDSPDLMTPRTHLKIKFRSAHGMFVFTNWLNETFGKDKWYLPEHHTREMRPTHGRITCRVMLFVPYAVNHKEFDEKWHDRLTLIGYHTTAPGEDFRFGGKTKDTPDEAAAKMPAGKHRSITKVDRLVDAKVAEILAELGHI